MYTNEDRETKELLFGESNADTPVSSSPEGNKPSGGDNSFYDRQQNKKTNTVWYKDWRGKTLGISLAALVLIGVGIPSGMAAAGYWAKYKGDQTNITNNDSIVTDYTKAMNEVEIQYDKAILAHYDVLVEEGYITQSAHDKKLDDAKKTANDTIDNKKEELKDQYGNTWKEKYDDFLQSSGFHTSSKNGEDEWRDSQVADAIESKVKDQYNEKLDLISYSSDNSDKQYVSTETNKHGKYAYIENGYKNDDYAGYSYTSQDLVTLYLLTYQPIVFNNSLLPFLPVEGANDEEANIQGDNVYMTNDDVMSAWSFYKEFTSGSFEQAAANYGGIQSKYNISFSSQSLGENADMAVELGLSGNSEDAGLTIDTLFSTAWTASGVSTDVTSITSTDIRDMNSTQVEAFSKSISDQLKTAGLLTAANGKTYRKFSTNGVVEKNTVSFVDTNGLNNIGIQTEGKDLIIDQLDNYAGVNGSIDYDLVASYSSWLESSFKYITLIDYFTDVTGDSWFDYTGLKLTLSTNDNWTNLAETLTNDGLDQNKFLLALATDPAVNSLNAQTSVYTEAEAFVEANQRDYDKSKFDSDVANELSTYTSTANMSKFSDEYFKKVLALGAGTRTNNKIIINERGDK